MIFFKSIGKKREGIFSFLKAHIRFIVLLTFISVSFFNITAVEAESVNDEDAWPVYQHVQASKNESSKSEVGEYSLGPGDVLDVRVYGEPDVSSIVIVRIDGNISLPLAGELPAAGRTPKALGQEIRQRLERFIEAPEVVVMLTESRSKSYYILGQVDSPGEYNITRPITVLQAIARAGGFGEWAKKDGILIVTEPGENEKIAVFDYDSFLRQSDSKMNHVIKPGDTIVVP